MNTTGHVVRWTALWCGILMAVATLTRSAFDWFVPPESFAARASASTYTAIALFLAAGFVATWRSRSVRAGALAGAASGLLSSVVVAVALLVLLGIWHDEGTLLAIERSGGLGEEFQLPFMVIVPGTVIATLGAALARGFQLLGLTPHAP